MKTDIVTIGGIYFGNETAKAHIKADLNLIRIRQYLEAQKKKLLWIPYFTAREELEIIKATAVFLIK